MNHAIIMTAFVVLFGASAAAQDTNVQLLQEVRQLREAIEMLVSTGARVQIVFGRLQLQEQRTATSSRRLDELRAAAARLGIEIASLTGKLQDWDEAVRDSRTPAADRQALEEQTKHSRRELERMTLEHQRLQGEESQAAGALASEQARWAELNQQLEDLERVLSKRP